MAMGKEGGRPRRAGVPPKRKRTKGLHPKPRSFKGVKPTSTTNPEGIHERSRKRHEKERKKKNKKQRNEEDEEEEGVLVKDMEGEKKNASTRHAQTISPDASPSQQLQYFFDRLRSAVGVTLSSLELEEISDSSVVELPQSLGRDVGNFNKHIKAIFGDSWKATLCQSQLVEGKVDAGSPAVLIICASALRSLELLRGLRTLTRECRAVKLFSKHMKVEEQVSLLKSRVNIACGTPNRIQKLIDMDALVLSRLSVIVIDMHLDAKGYSLLTLPQVSLEFWDLYKTHFHGLLQGGKLRICFY
ncbi:protein CMS1 [Nymphaea colorata]|nr:protein CMS1 [Nymphaea colorata]